MYSRSRGQRLHHSSPTLDVESSPVPRQKHEKKKTWRQKGDEALCFTVSAIYAKILVILGVALPITDAIAIRDYNSYDGFYLYLYIGSILFLLYMYLIQMKHKSVDNTSQCCTDDSDESIGCQFINKNNHIKYGSFYFRMGVTAFGIGSVIHSGLQFGQYFELSSKQGCNNLLKAAKPLFRICFALLQMVFIFSFNNFLNVQRSKIIARFGLMHMIATNICEWLFVIVEETQIDIYKCARNLEELTKRDNVSLHAANYHFLKSHAFRITKHIYEHKYSCLTSNIMDKILVNSQQYLAPCTVEYSLLCSVILGLIWRNSYIKSCSESSEKPAAQVIKETYRGCHVIHGRNQSQLSLDCSQAHKGLFSGILALVITIISIIMFFELVSYKEYKEIAVIQVNICEAVLFWAATAAAIFCIIALRDMECRKLKISLELEHLLLLVTQSGIFMYFLFQIIGAILMGPKKGIGGIIRIITPLSALVQSSWQTVLVLDAWRRRCSTEDQMRRKPGRQLITFLLVANISLWIVNRLKNTRAVSHPNQMDVYGILAWNIITHVSMPLAVSYRFQSTVCFYEIWKHVYKVKPSVSSCC